jgi:hypothetical protein
MEKLGNVDASLKEYQSVILFPVGKSAQEWVWGMIMECLKSKRHLRVSGGGIADVVFKGIKIIGGVQDGREKVVRFEHNLVLVVVGICNKMSGDAGKQICLSIRRSRFMCRQSSRAQMMASISLSYIS